MNRACLSGGGNIDRSRRIRQGLDVLRPGKPGALRNARDVGVEIEREAPAA